ncbi:hypothetical protein TNCV_3853301 [Trichonephila clavipes]|nr:hypothetical protein TNCV_3853301 [Trichonephila clavipes]
MEIVRLFPWPARSPIQNVWSMPTERLDRHHTPVTTVDELWYRGEVAGSSVPVHVIQSLFDSMTRSISDVITARGFVPSQPHSGLLQPKRVFHVHVLSNGFILENFTKQKRKLGLAGKSTGPVRAYPVRTYGPGEALISPSAGPEEDTKI